MGDGSGGPPPFQSEPDRFLVCGLGSLGQHCVVFLKRFGVRVSAIELEAREDWEIPRLREHIDRLIIGDCRRSDILTAANIAIHRAVLLVTSDDRVNMEAAFEARLQNPGIRLVVRSAKQNLNRLLSQELGDFIAFEPKELSAPAFALAAMGEGMPACFRMDGVLAQVIRQVAAAADPLVGKTLYSLNTPNRRVLSHHTPGGAPFRAFNAWHPETTVKPGDTVVFIHIDIQKHRPVTQSGSPFSRIFERLMAHAALIRGSGGAGLRSFFRNGFQDQTRRVAIVCGLTILGLLLFGGVLFFNFGPGISWVDSVYATIGLLLGGYTDLLGAEFRFEQPVPWWLRLFGLALTLMGTVFVGVLYALMTQALIGTRFRFSRRPRIPAQGHVVVIGLSHFGRRVVARLLEFQKAVVGIGGGDDGAPQEPSVNVPCLSMGPGGMDAVLNQAHLDGATSVIAVTRDEMENLEMALMAQRLNPDMTLVIRTYHPRFSESLARLFPCARVLCVSALAAEAFVAAAFGEKVAQLFRLDDQTIIVTEYTVEPHDTLNGLMLSEVASGYGVVPILLASPVQGADAIWMPPEDHRLSPGDILFVLATMEGLRRIELGTLLPRQCVVRVNGVRKALMAFARFEGANVIARISGCDMGSARDIMERLPAELPQPVYRHQGYLIVKMLKNSLVDAELLDLHRP